LPTGFGKLKEVKLIAMEVCAAPAGALMGEMEWLLISDLAARCAEAPPTPPPLA
jgi:hypothetical protein